VLANDQGRRLQPIITIPPEVSKSEAPTEEAEMRDKSVFADLTSSGQ
jgi:hypothetical protein